MADNVFTAACLAGPLVIAVTLAVIALLAVEVRNARKVVR